MSGTPEITTRPEQPYVAVREQVAMAELGGLAARFGELFGWLGAHGVAPAGPPFFKYDVIEMTRGLDMEAGVPVATATDGDGAVVAGVLPAGRYVTVIHVGHPRDLERATGELLDWAAREGLKCDMTPGDRGEQWGSRVEFYLTDPNQEPDMNKWQTQLAFRLAD
jgi:effector-binding domain-containing protein